MRSDEARPAPVIASAHPPATNAPATDAPATDALALDAAGARAPAAPVRAVHDSTPGVAAATLTDATVLASRGVDAELVVVPQRSGIALETQRQVDRAIHERSPQDGYADWLFDPAVHPSGNSWRGVSRRAIALHTLYNIDRITNPAEGIDPHVFDEPLFGRGDVSARQLLQRELAPERAVRVIAKYDSFLDGIPLIDSADEFGLTSRDYLFGAADSHAVRSRAEVMKTLGHEHVAEHPSPRPLRIASIACGLAQPTLELARELEDRGTEVSEVVFVDHDPMALAMVRSLSRGSTAAAQVRTVRRNFLVQPLAEVVGAGGVDIVDLVGAFEHLPTVRNGFRIAASVLADAADAVRPGGLILLGNMLRERPQQAFFDNVWPRLHQRSMYDVLELVSQAGLAPELTRIRIPASEGIYAVYGVRVPERRGPSVRDRARQRLLMRMLRRSLPSY